MVVYLIKNRINGRLYVGQTVRSVEARWYQHTKCKGCPVLRAAIEKYGSENFQITVLKECISIEDLNASEELFIKHFLTLAPRGYNLNTGGGNARHSELAKKKISAANKGRIRTAEHCHKLSQIHSGKTLSEEHKDALHTSRRGKPMSKEHREKIRAALKGKKKSLEHRQALSKAKKKENRK